ncbi:TED1-like protein [Elsinoe australis]|uniref:TED1-like protein n=1 Tax=Elsinoe australis TaxID=40998 RepID=A0A4U7AY47_9PEZI|nr:TED1-like protein [Elsinoe australis]
MRLYNVLLTAWKFLALVAVLSSAYIYLYPAVHGCKFPSPQDGSLAPFRLLALGDPQLEGDTSLPKATDPTFPSLGRLSDLSKTWSVNVLGKGLIDVAKELVKEDIPKLLHSYRKRIDLVGNDYYLAHVYRTVTWWTQPSHGVVLGDLLGSQWMNDEEFERRSHRFWTRAFRGAEKIPDNIFDYVQVVPEGSMKWDKSLITVAGNHDIGYAGDLDESTVERFEKRYGKVNWYITFGLENGQLRMLTRNQAAFAEGPRLKVIVLNTMNLDSPVHSKALQEETKRFLDDQIGSSAGQGYLDATVLLTHIPLHKQEGLCVDSPFFTHYPDHHGAGISEQNHLTESSSRSILDGLYEFEGSFATAGMILNGHDHEGCDVIHARGAVSDGLDNVTTSSIGDWTSLRREDAQKAKVRSDRSVREVTVRSMMGAYGGNSGLVSGWFDKKERRWRFEYQSCMFGVQHIWWAVHILDLVTVLVGLALIPLSLLGAGSFIEKQSNSVKKNQ